MLGALETEMLFGQSFLLALLKDGAFHVSEERGETVTYLFTPPHFLGSGMSTPMLHSKYFYEYLSSKIYLHPSSS